jgi:SAM-dependent methyltransferase
VTATSSPQSRTGSDGGGAAPYERFVNSVVAQQLRRWLPVDRARVLDISRTDVSRGSTTVSATVARTGHDVIRVLGPEALTPPAGPIGPQGPQGPPVGVGRHPSVRLVVGDTRSLDWFRSDRFDAIVAEGSALSSALATEATVEQAARLLRPGGRLLLSVDSLLYGLARLAEQHRWPELADTHAGDVVLVPDGDPTDDPDGPGLTRCFGPEELRELMEAAGFSVDWVRPRTVLPPDVVAHAVRNDPGVLPELVATELDLATDREGESLGNYLSLSATRRS